MGGPGDDGTTLARVLAIVEAQGAQIALLTERLVSGGSGRRSDKTLGEAYELYEATWEHETWARSMRATFAPVVRHWRDKKADHLTRADWTHMRDHVRAKEPTIRRDPKTRERTLPAKYTLNQEFKRWGAFYRWCVKEGHLHTNPLFELKGVRGAKKHRHTRPSEEEVIRLLVAGSDRMRAFVIVGARTGMRASEVRTLKWKNVDLERGRIRIEWQNTKGKKERFIPLTSDAVAALRRVRPDIPPRHVFESERCPGHPVVASTLWLEFRQTADGVGIEAAAGDGRVVFHDLRHTFAAWASGQLPLPVVAAIGGWSDLRTMSRYIQVSESEIADAQKTLEKAVRRGPQRNELDEFAEAPAFVTDK